MELEVIKLKRWQAKLLNGVAWAIGIRGEDVWCMTLTKGAIDAIKQERDKDKEYEDYEENAYCVRCKDLRLFGTDAIIEVKPNGRRMRIGKCPECKNTMNRILQRRP